MSPIIVCIRSGEGLHTTHDNPNIPDPFLSVKGHEMCIALRQKLVFTMSPAMDAHLIITSPLRRATQTAWYTFFPEIQANLAFRGGFGMEVQPTSRLQPITDRPCDTGTITETLEMELPEIDWGCLSLDWPEKTEFEQWNKWAVDQRVVALKNRLKDASQTKEIIIVVSHGDFLLALTGKKFAAADYRIFEFAGNGYDDSDTGGKLIEWNETEMNGGGMGRSPRGNFGLEALAFPALSEQEQAEIDLKFQWKNNGILWRQESIVKVSEALVTLASANKWFIKKNTKKLRIDAALAQDWEHTTLNYVDHADEFLNPYADDIGRGDGRAYRGEWA